MLCDRVSYFDVGIIAVFINWAVSSPEKCNRTGATQ